MFIGLKGGYMGTGEFLLILLIIVVGGGSLFAYLLHQVKVQEKENEKRPK